MENQKRKWSIQTQHTRSIGARLPNDLFERLKTFCAQHGETTTGVVCSALEQYMDSYEDDGKEDGGYFLYDAKKPLRSVRTTSQGLAMVSPLPYGGELGI